MGDVLLSAQTITVNCLTNLELITLLVSSPSRSVHILLHVKTLRPVHILLHVKTLRPVYILLLVKTRTYTFPERFLVLIHPDFCIRPICLLVLSFRS